MTSSKKEYYIKGISISREKFEELRSNICKRYSNLTERVSFSEFQRGILFAFILGNLSAHGDYESVRLFFSCLLLNDIPMIKIFEYKDEIKIYLYIYV